MHQTYRELEVLLVDDCGTDDSIAIVQRMLGSKEDAIIDNVHYKILHHEHNRGLSAARNSGIDNAKGTYIYFLDSDDYIEQNTLERIVDEIEKGYSFVSFNYTMEYPDKKLKSSFASKTYLFSNEIEKTKFICFDLAKYEFGWESWTMLFRKDLIDKYSLRFEDNKIIFAEDLYFKICYSLISDSYSVIEDNLYHYRVRSGSIMNSVGNYDNTPRFLKLSKAIETFTNKNDLLKQKKYFISIHYAIICHAFIRLQCIDPSADDYTYYNSLRSCKDKWSDIMLKNMRFCPQLTKIYGIDLFLLNRAYAYFYLYGRWKKTDLRILSLYRWLKKVNCGGIFRKYKKSCCRYL